MVMRVFVAGGTGVRGRRLVPQLLARGHQVTATTTSAAKAPGRQPHTRRWAERIGSYDAYVVVTPEYNTAPPAALTNAIDYLYAEWGGKPVGYVGYGSFGPVMAVQRLRAQAGVLRMADIGPQVALSLREDFVDLVDFRPRELHTAELHRLVDELLAWARALAPLRTLPQAG